MTDEKLADERPAQPARVRDDDGDLWKRCPDGLYRVTPGWIGLSLEKLREEYGAHTA